MTVIRAEHQAGTVREFQTTFVRKLGTSEAGFGLLGRWPRQPWPLGTQDEDFSKARKISL